jgi:hypothetical protein
MPMGGVNFEGRVDWAGRVDWEGRADKARENREHLRGLLRQRQPELAAALESAARELSSSGECQDAGAGDTSGSALALAAVLLTPCCAPS